MFRMIENATCALKNSSHICKKIPPPQKKTPQQQQQQQINKELERCSDRES